MGWAYQPQCDLKPLGELGRQPYTSNILNSEALVQKVMSKGAAYYQRGEVNPWLAQIYVHSCDPTDKMLLSSIFVSSQLRKIQEVILDNQVRDKYLTAGVTASTCGF